MTFLQAVNRLLRIEGIIRGDDDAASSFSDTAHSNMIQMARIAIEDTLADLTSAKLIPYEEAQGHISVSQGTRTYNLASDFIRFIGQNPFMEQVSAATTTGTATGDRIYMYKGGEQQLRIDDHKYQEEQNEPQFWYPVNTSTAQVGFWRVPDGTYHYRYWYQKDVSVSVAADNLPFSRTPEADAFCQAASIRFRMMRLDPDIRKQLYPMGAEKDPEYAAAKSRIFELLRRYDSFARYGRKYR